MDPYTSLLALLVPTSIMVWMTKGHIGERFMSYRSMRKKKKAMHANVQNEFANMLRMMVATNQITAGDRISVENKLTKAGYDVSDEPTYGSPRYVKLPHPNVDDLKLQIKARLGPKVIWLMDALKFKRRIANNKLLKSSNDGLKVKKKA